MSNKQGNENKWKDFLLKSSLPLEQLVAQKLGKKGLHVAGEYPYIRPNEQDISTEFSVDLYAYRTIKPSSTESDCWKRLNLLVECKYNYPGIKWIFSPQTRWNTGVGYIGTFLNGKKHCYHTIERFLPSCTRGIELNNTGFDPNTISHGLNQLRYGMPNLILQKITTNLDKQMPDKPQISLIGLILVTTADLYVLKPDLDLESYYLAENLNDVAEPVSHLVVLQERGPHLQEYCEHVIKNSIKRPNINVSDASIIVESSYIKNSLETLIPKSSSIIVVNINFWDEIIDEINDVFLKNTRWLLSDLSPIV